jgi:hypothetical protein
VNIREAWERFRGQGDDAIDELARLEKTDPQLAAQTRIAMRRNSQGWTGIPGGFDGDVVPAKDRGGRDSFLRQDNGNYLILGEDEKWHEITEEYARSMGLIAVGRLVDARDRMSRGRDTD